MAAIEEPVNAGATESPKARAFTTSELTTFENLATLARWLHERATAAVFDDGYVRLRPSLNKVWLIEPRTDAKGRRRTVFGDYDSSSTVTGNEEQFTRYSRLLHFLTRRKIGHAGKA